MAVLRIITEGDPRLREKSIKVRKVDDEVRRLIEDMRETMVAASGVGLAAPQVGIMRRIIVVGIPEGYENEGDPPIDVALINPEIVRATGHQLGIEGCLSIPKWYGEVSRAMNVTVKGRDVNDREVRIKASGQLARALQHEIDHLNGILFVDHIEDRSKLYHVSELEEEAEDSAPAEAAGVLPK